MRSALVLFALLLAPAAIGQESAVPAGLGLRVANDYVAPVVSGFVAGTETLSGAAEQLCAAPSEESLAATRNAFEQTITAWGRLSMLRFGPIVAENRYETIFFWPDPRGVTLKQVQQALADEDTSVTDPAVLAEKSVALQNLLAVEFLTAGTGAETLASADGQYRCAYLASAASLLHRHAQDIEAGWSETSPIGASFRHPEEGSYFRSDKEVLAELLKAMRTGVEYVQSAEILPPLGETVGEARGRRAPLWRSNLTFTLISAQLSGLVELIDASGLKETLTATQAAPLDNLRFDLAQAAASLSAIELPAEMAFADPEARKKLDFANLMLGYSVTTISKDLTEALGLTMGFNALDGD